MTAIHECYRWNQTIPPGICASLNGHHGMTVGNAFVKRDRAYIRFESCGCEVVANLSDISIPMDGDLQSKGRVRGHA